MNKNIYRIVWNTSVNALQVVGEYARTKGHKTCGSGTGGALPASLPTGFCGRLQALTFCCWMALGASVTYRAVADNAGLIVADPTAPQTQQATVLNTANGVLQVNIQTPSAAGVSRNVFSQFNVPEAGTILNNSRTDTTTQLAGWVQGNPWLVNGSARVILNEVNSSNHSMLQGYMEIAGSKAELVIANPAGISCSGCGFINASRAVLTTGTALWGSTGNLDGFRVSGGRIVVDGLGMDVSRVDYTDLISRYATLNAMVYGHAGSVLNTTLGVQDVKLPALSDAATVGHGVSGGVVPNTAAASTAITTAVALDVAALGGMYAGKIALVGTEQGLGVNNAGQWSAGAGGLTLNADGWLKNTGKIESAGSVQVHTAGVQQSGTLTSQQELIVRSREGLNNQGTVTAARLDIQTPVLDNTTGHILQSGVNALDITTGQLVNRDGQLGDIPSDGSSGNTGTGSTGTSTGSNTGSNTGNNTGSTSTNGTGSSTGGAGSTAPVVRTWDTGRIDVTGLLNNTQGEVNAGGGLNLAVQGSLNNDQGAMRLNQLQVQGTNTDTLSNVQGRLWVDGALVAGSSNTPIAQLNNSQGFIQAGTVQAYAGQVLNAQGKLHSAGALQLSSTGGLDNTQGQLTAQGALQLHHQQLNNTKGVISGQNNVNVVTAEHLNNTQGQLLAQGEATLSSSSLDNTEGQIVSKQSAAITTTHTFNNTLGLIKADHNVQAQVGSLFNAGGQVVAGKGLHIDATEAVHNVGDATSSALLQAGEDAAVTAKYFEQVQSTTRAGRDALIRTQGNLVQRGLVAASGNITATAAGAVFGQGDYIAGLDANGQATQNASLQLTAAQHLQAQGRTVASQVDITGQQVDVAGGEVRADALTLTATQGDIRTARAVVMATQATLTADAAPASGLDNTQGFIQADTLQLKVQQLNNTQGLIRQTGAAEQRIALDAATGVLNNTQGRIESAATHLNVSAHLIDSTQGTVQHTGNGVLQLNSDTLRAPNSLWQSNGDVHIHTTHDVLLQGAGVSANGLNVDSGGQLDASAAQLVLNGAVNLYSAGALSTANASVSSLGDITIDAATLDHTAGVLQGQQIGLKTTGLSNTTDGQIVAAKDLRLQVGALDNTRGQLLTQGALTVNSTGQVINNAGLMQSTLAGSIGAVGDVHNEAGSVSAGEQLTLTSQGDVVNSAAGRLVSNQTVAVSGKNVYNTGNSRISAGGDVALNTLANSQGVVDNSQGIVVADGNVSLNSHGGNLINRSGQIHALGHSNVGDVVLNVGAVQGEQGTMVAAQDVQLSASGDVQHRQGTLVAGRDVWLSTTGALNNSQGAIQAEHGQVQLTAQADINNTAGMVLAAQALNSQSTGLNNAQGVMQGDTVQINTQGGVLNNSEEGQLIAQQTLTLNTGTLNNSTGLIQNRTQGSLVAITATGDVVNTASGNTGGIISQGDLSVSSTATLDNSTGFMIARQTAQLSAQQANNTQGFIQADALQLTLQQLNNTQGLIRQTGAAEQTIGLDATTGVLNNTQGRIESAATHLNVSAHLIDSTQGTVQHAGNGVLQLNSDTLRAPNSLWQSNGDVHIHTTHDVLLQGAGVSANGLNVDSGGLLDASAAQLVLNGAVNLHSAGALSTANASVSSLSDITIDAATLDHTAGVLQGQHISVLSTGLSNTRDGRITAAKDLRLQVGALDNTRGQLLTQGEFTLNSAGQVINNAGLMQSTLAGSIGAVGDVHNEAGVVSAGEQLTLSSQGDVVNSAAGRLVSNQTVAVTAKNVYNTGNSRISAGGDVALNTLANSQGMMDNSQGTVVADGNVSLNSHGGDLINRNGQIHALGNSNVGDVVLNVGAVHGEQGTMVAAQDVQLTASGDVQHNQGTLVAGRDVWLSTTGALNNSQGAIQAEHGQVQLTAQADIDNTAGTVLAAQALNSQSAGLNNAQGVMQGDTVQVNTQGGVLNNTEQGQLIAQQNITLTTGVLNNSTGLIQNRTQGALVAITATGDVVNTASGNTGGIISQGDLSVSSTANLDNSTGYMSAANTLNASAQHLNNQGTAEAVATVQAGKQLNITTTQGLDNRGGVVQSGGDATLQLGQGLLNNSGVLADGSNSAASLVYALNALTVDVGQLNNSNTGAGAGVQAGDVHLNAQQVNNNAGHVLVQNTLDARIQQQLDNRGGVVSANTVRVVDPVAQADVNAAGKTLVVQNTGGQLLAGSHLMVDAAQLGMDGVLSSQQDAVLRFYNDIDLNGSASGAAPQVGRNLHLNTTGTINNSSALEVAGLLDVSATTLNNTATGRMNAGSTTVNATTLNNQGLIDGGQVRLNANVLNNTGTGRIYGDVLGIAAGTLNNTATYALTGSDLSVQSAVIAARGQLHLGVGTLNNGSFQTFDNSTLQLTSGQNNVTQHGSTWRIKDDSLVFSAGDMHIGGALDAAGQATGQAAVVNNISTTIEALGDVNINTDVLNNTNPHFTTRLVQIGLPRSYTLIQPEGSTLKLDRDDFVMVPWSRAGRLQLKNDADRGIGELGKTELYRVHELKESAVVDPNAGDDGSSGGTTTTEPENYYDIPADVEPKAIYPKDDPAWAYFNLTPPVDRPIAPVLQQPIAPDSSLASSCDAATLNQAICDGYTASVNDYNAQLQANTQAQQDYDTALDAWKTQTNARYSALDAAIVNYNTQFDLGPLRSWTHYDLTDTVKESQVEQSVPARIIAGGDMQLQGNTLINDKSQMIAGGQLIVSNNNLTNIDGTGIRQVTTTGSSQFSAGVWRGGFKRYYERKERNYAVYNPPAVETTMIVPVTAVLTNTAAATGNTATAQAGVNTQTSSTQAVVETTVNNTSKATRSAAALWHRQNALSADTPTAANVQGAALTGLVVKNSGSQASKATTVSPTAQQTTGAAVVTAPNAPTANSSSLMVQPGVVTRIALPSSQAGVSPLEVRTTLPSLSIPSTALFKPNTDPASTVLIETDPQFAGYNHWLGSDYMLRQFETDPNRIQKRLGDGFYEQKLVREQIMTLTGRRYLGDYRSDDAQYKALMDAGLSFAKAYNLRPGIALSEAQLLALTTDIVWLVEQTVTLPNGTQAKALVPQVYVRLKQGDLTGDGSLLSGDVAQLKVQENVQNQGTIAGRKLVDINTGGSIVNTGSIRGKHVQLDAGKDLANVGGSIRAEDSLYAHADNDIALTTTTKHVESTSGASSYSRTFVDRVAGLYVDGAQGSLTLEAGRDIHAAGADIVNKGTGSTKLLAGRDVDLNAVQTGWQDNMVEDAQRYLKQGERTDQGVRVRGAGDVTINAGNNVRGQGVQINSRDGTVRVEAEHDVELLAGQREKNYAFSTLSTGGSLLAKETTERKLERNSNEAVQSNVEGKNVLVRSKQGDVTIVGSQVNALNAAQVEAAGDVVVRSAVNTQVVSSETRTSNTIQFKNTQQGSISQTLSKAGISGANVSIDGKNIQLDAAEIKAKQDLRIGDAQLKTDADGNMVLDAKGRPVVEVGNTDKISMGTVKLTNETWDERQKGFKGPVKELARVASVAVAGFGVQKAITIGESSSNKATTTREAVTELGASNMQLGANTVELTGTQGKATGTALVLGNDIALKTAQTVTNQSSSHTVEQVSGEGVKLKRDSVQVGAVSDTKTSTSQSITQTTHQGVGITGNDVVVLADLNKGSLQMESAKLKATNSLLVGAKTTVATGVEDTTQKTTGSKVETTRAEVGVHHAAVDVYNAADNVVKAGEEVKHAKEALQEAKDRVARGELSADSIKEYEANVAAALVNLTQAQIALGTTAAGVTSTAATAGFSAKGTLTHSIDQQQQSSSQGQWNGTELNGDTVTLMGDSFTGKGVTSNSNNLNLQLNRLTLEAGTNSYSSTSQNSSSSQSASMSTTGSASASASKQNSSSSSSGVDYTNSRLNTGNVQGNLEQITLNGVRINADAGTLITRNLEVRTVQNSSSSQTQSKGINVGIGGGSAGVTGGNVGFNKGNGSGSSLMATEQSGIVFADATGNNHQLTVLEHTSNVGGVIANAQGKTNFTTNSITTQDLQNHNRNEQRGFGLSAGVNNNPKADTMSMGTVGVQASHSGHILESTTRATIGEGAVVSSDANALSNVNRDISTATVTTKNQAIGGLKVDASIDSRVFSEKGRDDIIDEQKNIGKNVVNTGKMTAAAGAVGVATVINATKGGMDVGGAFKAATTPTDLAARVQNDPKLAAQIEAFKAGEYDNVAEARAALKALSESTGEDAQILLTTILGSAKGATDARSRDAGIIALDVNQDNRRGILATLGHELNHAAGSSSETASDLMGWASNALVEVATDANRSRVDAAKAGLQNATAAENAAVLQQDNARVVTMVADHGQEVDYSILPGATGVRCGFNISYCLSNPKAAYQADIKQDMQIQALLLKNIKTDVKEDVETIKNLPSTIYNLIQHPEVLKQLPEEVKKAFNDYLAAVKNNSEAIGQGLMTFDKSALDKQAKAEADILAPLAEALIGAGVTKVATTGGKVIVDKTTDVLRTIKNDPAKLPVVQMSDSGYINALKVTDNSKLIEPPANVKELQSKLADKPLDNAEGGRLREQIADSYFDTTGFTKLESKCGSNCFDGVYMKNGELYVVEVKPLQPNGVIKMSDNKNSPNNIGTQMSDQWIKNRAEELAKPGRSSAERATGQAILDAILDKKPINKIVVGINETHAVTLNLGNKVVIK